jgi:hypothetical protein
MKAPKIIKTVWHYSVDDDDCMGDYHSIDVYFDDLLVFQTGDEYHYKGYVSSTSWIKGVLFALGNPEPLYVIERIADSDL